MVSWASRVALVAKNLPANAGDIKGMGSIPGSERSPGGKQGTHSSLYTWRIPWTEEPGGLQSIGSQRVGHDWRDLAGTRAHGEQRDSLSLALCQEAEAILSAAESCHPWLIPDSNPAFQRGVRRLVLFFLLQPVACLYILLYLGWSLYLAGYRLSVCIYIYIYIYVPYIVPFV